MKTVRWARVLVAALLVPFLVSAAPADQEDDAVADPPTGGYYNLCGDDVGAQCGGDLTCVTFGIADHGVCLPPCVNDSDCPTTRGRSVCDVTLADGSQACALDCTFARCPSNTTCEESGKRNFCAAW